MSVQESGIPLYKSCLVSHGSHRDPRNSMSTRLLDDLLLELAPMRNDDRNSESSEFDKNDVDKEQGQDASDRRKKIIAKFQKLVLLQQASNKRDSTLDRPNDKVAVKQRGLADSTVANAHGIEEQSSLPKSESRHSLKLSKNVHIFAKSFSNLTKIAKATVSTTAKPKEARSLSSDSVLQFSPRESSTNNETWKQNVPERSSRFSLLKKMNSISRFGADNGEHLLNSSYNELAWDEDDPTAVDEAADDASLGDYVEYALGESLSSASRLNECGNDQRKLGNSASRTNAQGPNPSLDEHHLLSQRRRSSSGSGRSISSVERRRSLSGQRNRSRNRRPQTQLHGSDESLRALVEVLSRETPTPGQEKVLLEHKTYQRRKMKRCSLESEPASLPNLLSYEKDALSVRALTDSRSSNGRKEWKNDISSSMHCSRVRSSAEGRSLSKLPRADHYDNNSSHNASWDLGDTTGGKVYARRSVTSKAHQHLLNSSSVHSQSASIFAKGFTEQGEEAERGIEERKLSIRPQRVRSSKSFNNRSLPSLQAVSNDANTVGSVSEQRRRSTAVMGGKDNGQRLTRSPSAGSTYSLGSRSFTQVDTINGGLRAGSVSESNRNATWDVTGRRERHPISSQQSDGDRTVRSGKRRSLQNLPGVQDDTTASDTSRPNTGFDTTSDVTDCYTRELLLPKSAARVQSQSLKSKSMGVASFPNLQTIQSPGVYQNRKSDNNDAEIEQQLLRLMANRSLPALDVVQVQNDNIDDGSHNATWEPGDSNSSSQDLHLQLVLSSPGVQQQTSRSSSQLSQSLHKYPAKMAGNGMIDDAVIAALHASRARRAVRSSSLSQSLHSIPRTGSATGMDETNSRDNGTRRRRMSSHRRSIKSSVNRDGDLPPQDKEGSGDSSITPSSSPTTSSSVDCTNEKTKRTTTASRSLGKSIEMDQSHHKTMPSTTPSSSLSVTTARPTSSLDLLLQTPRPQPRSMQASRGNSSLPNLRRLANIDMDCGSSLGVDSQANATWDLDEVKEKAKSRSRLLKKSLGSQSFSNLQELALIRSKTASQAIVSTEPRGNRLSTSSIHASAREQPPLALSIQVR